MLCFDGKTGFFLKSTIPVTPFPVPRGRLCCVVLCCVVCIERVLPPREQKITNATSKGSYIKRTKDGNETRLRPETWPSLNIIRIILIIMSSTFDGVRSQSIHNGHSRLWPSDSIHIQDCGINVVGSDFLDYNLLCSRTVPHLSSLSKSSTRRKR